MRYQKHIKGVELAHFDSLTSMIEYADNESNVAPINRDKWKKEREQESNLHFLNGYDYDRAMRELSEPPQASSEVRDVMADIASSFEADVPVRRLRRHCEDGDELDPIAWITRDTNGWDRMERRPAARSVIRLACNIGVSCMRNAEDLYYRGAAAAALADALEAEGHSVEVTMVVSVYQAYHNSPVTTPVRVIETVLKHAHNSMDIDTLSLVLGEIGFFRTVGFTTMFACSNKETHHAMGKPKEMPDALAKEYDIVLDADCLTLADATATVKRYAERFKAGGEG